MDVRVTNGAVPSGHASRQYVISAIRNLDTIMAGAQPVTLTVDIQTTATNIRSYGFSLPGGEKLLALWTDGPAVDDDPGIEATLVLGGQSDKWVRAYDILHGVEQQVVTNVQDGNLVIPRLLIKDYPIVLRITSTNRTFLPLVSKGNAP